MSTLVKQAEFAKLPKSSFSLNKLKDQKLE